ncbi:MAG: PQQ-binding-like beta-propeller repeat protein [Bacteroidota bacterium]
MKISQLPQPKDIDWLQYGGSIERTNAARLTLNPPLNRLWEYDADAGYSVEGAVAEGGFLFISNLKGGVHVVNITNGQKISSGSLGSSICGSPVIDGSMMYVAISKDEKTLIGFDFAEGKPAWKDALGSIESSPLLLGENLYVVNLAGDLYCVNKQNGKTQWSYKNPDPESAALAHSTPVSDGHVIVFCRDDGAIFAVDAENGKLKWRTKTGKTIFATPSISGNNLYVGSLDSSFYSFDLTNGNLRWKRILDGRIYASAAVGNGFSYIGTGNGTLFCLTNDAGKIVWQVTTHGAISAAPLLSGDFLYAGSLDKTVYAFDCANGRVLWNWKCGGRIKTTPLIHEGLLILLGDDRTVTAFEEKRDHS